MQFTVSSAEDSEQRPRQPQQPLLQPRRAPADPGRQPGRGAQHEALAQPQAATHKYFLGVINYFFANKQAEGQEDDGGAEGRQHKAVQADGVLQAGRYSRPGHPQRLKMNGANIYIDIKQYLDIFRYI